jgi:hypothetical protein
MDALFGDASTAATPATIQGERGSLMGVRSPVPSLDIRRQHGHPGAENAIPGMDIDHPGASNEATAKADSPKPQEEDIGSRSDGIGGWFSSLISRRKGSRQGNSSQYKRLGQGEDE